MKKFADALALLAVTVWVGALWGVGYVAVPVLFQAQPDKMLAGMLAGQMFSLVGWIGIACACYLLAHQLSQAGAAALRQKVFYVAAGMLLLTLASQFGIQPVMTGLKAQAFPGDVMQSQFAGQFRMLHGIASVLYLVQSLLGIILVLKVKRTNQP
jgi:Domain of unknown function (DUF4149)